VHRGLRRLVYPIAWAVATAVTAGIAWLGMGSVLTAASPGRAAPISVTDLRGAAPRVTAMPAPSPSPPVKVSPAPSDSWSGASGGVFRRQFRTFGGDVVVLSSLGEVTIESAAPQPGYTVAQSRQAADSVIVSFVGPHRASRVWARWNNGPYAEVTEVTGYFFGTD
jgi:hypothetical protein